VVSYDEFRDVCKCTDYVNVLIRSRCYEDTPSPADGYQLHNSGAYYSSDPVGYYDDNGHPVIPNRSYAEYNGHYDYSDDGVGYQRSGSFEIQPALPAIKTGAGSMEVMFKVNEVIANPSQCLTTVARSLTSLAGQLSITGTCLPILAAEETISAFSKS
jgi:hypothetical protein